MDILGLVDGVIDFVVEAWSGREHNYNKAIEILTSLELDKIIQDFSNIDQYKEIKKIIRHYRDMSETQLLTIRDLLRFMLTVKSSHAPLQLNSDTVAKINELELKYERERDRTMGEVGGWDLRFWENFEFGKRHTHIEKISFLF